MLQLAKNLFSILGISFLRFRPIPRVWVIFLVTVNMGCLYFIAELEAQVVLATTTLALLVQALIYERTGFARILGASHLLWVPMFAWLATRLESIAAVPGFQEWIALLFLTNCVSLVIDVLDVRRYFRGETAPHYVWARTA